MSVSLTITVTDAQALRARTAYGHRDANPQSPTFGQWLLATGAEMQDFIKAWVKTRTIDYETTIDAETNRNTKSGEVW